MRKIDNQARRLFQLTEAISRRAGSIGQTVGGAERDLVDVVICYLRAMVVQARAIALLASSGGAEASFSNLRSLFELYVDYRFLLLLGESKDEKTRKARRIMLYAMHESAETFAKTAFSPAAINRMKSAVSGVAEIEPEMYAAFMRDWAKGKRGHWSGLSRTEVMNRVDPGGSDMLRDVYKLLSWESHGVMIAVVDIQKLGGGGTLHEYRIPQERVVQYACDEAARCLRISWHGVKYHGWWPPRMTAG